MLYENDILNTETLDLNSRGMVVSMADGVATVAGLQDVLAGELVSFGEVQGLALNIEKRFVKVVVLHQKILLNKEILWNVLNPSLMSQLVLNYWVV